MASLIPYCHIWPTVTASIDAQLANHLRIFRLFIPVIVRCQLSGKILPGHVVGKDDADPVTVADDRTNAVGAFRARHDAQYARPRFHDHLTSRHLAYHQHEPIEGQLNPFPDPLTIVLEEDPIIGIEVQFAAAIYFIEIKYGGDFMSIVVP